MQLEEFETAINDAIAMIPANIRAGMKNVAFVVDDQRLGNLLGQYHGIPLPQRGQGYSGVLPDTITIYKRTIEAVTGDDDQRTIRLITETVHHEIAHYFGFNEAKVRSWERHRRTRRSPSVV